MKLKIVAALAFSSLLFASCGENAEKETVVEETPVAEKVIYTANAADSKVNWKGEVAGVYGHSGYVNLASGIVELSEGNLVGGEFVVDMTGIYPTDSAYKFDEDNNPEKLAGHLATEDFFNTAVYPTATFKITSVEGNKVAGDLTVRGKTNPETFEVSNIEVTDNGVNLAGTLVFDRQKYDVAWVHFMKDMILSDDIMLQINVVATK